MMSPGFAVWRTHVDFPQPSYGEPVITYKVIGSVPLSRSTERS